MLWCNNIVAVCAQVAVHDTAITELRTQARATAEAAKERTVNLRMGWKAQATIVAALIAAASSVVIALVK